MIYLATTDLEQKISQLGLKTVAVSSVILIVFCVLAALLKKHKALKLPLFLVLAGTMIISTGILFASTVYLNTKAESGGPVHWHSDIEFWACGSELNLRDPSSKLSNKVGTSSYHEHNDKRIHLEGVVVRKSEDASLEKFMRVTGGYIHDKGIGIPLSKEESTWLATHEQQDADKQDVGAFEQLRSLVKQGRGGRVLELNNGQKCGNDKAELQVFVYSYNEEAKTYSQTKLAHPSNYTMREESTVPPGDCVIVEFDTLKARTNKLCRQYGIRDQKRCVEFGVKEFNPDLCNIRETGGGSL
jgi:hypothetical protein